MAACGRLGLDNQRPEGSAVVQRPHLTRLGLAAVLVVIAALVIALPAGARPAVSCGTVGSKGKRYSVRAHLLACSSARTASRNYLSNGKKPRGYTCVKYNPRVTRVV